jgi:hypothetical protein
LQPGRRAVVATAAVSSPERTIASISLDHRAKFGERGEVLLIGQDKQYGRDPFDCLATSRKNLIALGYQNLHPVADGPQLAEPKVFR